MKKKLLTAFIFALAITTLIACGEREERVEVIENDEDTTEEINEVSEDVQESIDDEEDKHTSTDSNDGQLNEVSVSPGESHSVTVSVEGMDTDKNIQSYVLNPYGIVYEVEDILGKPSIDENYTITHDNGFIKISIRVIEDEILEEVVSNQLQSEDIEAVEEINANNYVGKGYSFGTTGFIAYEVEDNVFLATYEHSEEAYDGFGVIFNLFKDSISIQ